MNLGHFTANLYLDFQITNDRVAKKQKSDVSLFACAGLITYVTGYYYDYYYDYYYYHLEKMVNHLNLFFAVYFA